MSTESTLSQNQDFLGKGIAYPFSFVRQTGSTLVSTSTSENRVHIRQSIEQILGTWKSERFMNPEFGCDMRRVVFEPNTSVAKGLLRHFVYDAIRRWEPRVELLGIDFDDAQTDAGRNELPARIRYRIIATQVEDNLVYPFYREA